MKKFDNTAEHNALVERSLPLVHWTICRYFSCNESMVGLGYDDLFQEGCLALCHAASSYDSTRGKFSTFAVKVIRNHLIDYCRELHSDARDDSTISLEQMTLDGREDELQCDALPLEENVMNRIDTLSMLESRKRQYQGVARLGVEALMLKTMGGFGVTEIARAYGVKPNQVGSWMSRAVQKMRKDMTEEEKDSLGVEKAS